MEPAYKTYELLAKKTLLHIDLHKTPKRGQCLLLFFSDNDLSVMSIDMKRDLWKYVYVSLNLITINQH